MEQSIPTDSNNSVHFCAICMNSIDADERCVAIDCMHQLCHNCLEQWLNTKSSCPSCDKIITSVIYNIKSDIDYEQQIVEHWKVDPKYDGQSEESNDTDYDINMEFNANDTTVSNTSADSTDHMI